MNSRKLGLVLIPFLGVLLSLAGVNIADANISQQSAVQKTPLTAVNMVEIPRLSDASQSPDGRYVTYLKRVTDWEKDRHIDQYHLIDLQTLIEIPILEPERKGESFSKAVWSPDSRGFLYYGKSTKKKDGKTVVSKRSFPFLYNVKTGQSKRLFKTKSPLRGPQWSADGKQIYFMMSAKSTEEKSDVPSKIRDAIDRYDRPKNRSLWVFDLQTEKLSEILKGDFSVSSFNLTKTDDSILIAHAPSRLSDDRISREVYLLDVPTGKMERLTENTYSESAQNLSPNGKNIAYIATVNHKGEPYYEDNLFIQKIGEEPELILPKMAIEVLDFEWSADGMSVFILGNSGLVNQLYRYNLADKELTALTKGDHEIRDWVYNPETGDHFFFKENQNNPGELYRLASDGMETQLTNAYDKFQAQTALGQQTAFYWTGKNRENLEGILVYPINWKRGDKPFPLVTITHGGPRSSSQYGSWNVSRSVNVFAGQGYGVFLPNHRGGTGYGDKFMRDMVGGYFKNSDDDVMSGIDALIDAGFADPNALIKQGWSAGGHMTSWLITQSNRFKAASSGAGVADWVSMYGESDVRYARSFIFGGDPWSKGVSLKRFKKDSPLYQAHKVTTPTLFWAGEEDIRVPPTQSILMHRAVKATGTPTEYYQADGEPHNFRKPSHQLFKMNTELAWYGKYLKKPYTPTYPELNINTD